MKEAIAEIRAGKIKPCYLLWGEEEYLVEDALSRLVEEIIPPDLRNLNLLVMDGESLEVKKLYEALLTYPLIGGNKAVVVKGARFFQPSRVTPENISRIRELARSDPLQAAKEFTLFLGRLGWKVSDLVESDGWKRLEDDKWRILGDDRTWIPSLIQICLSHGLAPSEAKGEEETIGELISSRIPPGHTLILTARSVDERMKLYRMIAHLGWIIHFPNVTQERDKRALLAAHAESILNSAGKRMTDGAWNLLGAKTGYSLRETMGELEKLVVLTGDKKTITEEDVASTVEKTKEESVFSLISALAKKDEKEALRLLHELIEQGTMPLAILSLLARELGLLLRAKMIIEVKGLPGERTEMREFQRQILPSLKEEGPEIASLHPYVAYNLMKNALHFKRDQLLAGIQRLADIDKLIKTSPCDPYLAIESFVLSFQA